MQDSQDSQQMPRSFRMGVGGSARLLRPDEQVVAVRRRFGAQVYAEVAPLAHCNLRRGGRSYVEGAQGPGTEKASLSFRRQNSTLPGYEGGAGDASVRYSRPTLSTGDVSSRYESRTRVAIGTALRTVTYAYAGPRAVSLLRCNMHVQSGLCGQPAGRARGTLLSHPGRSGRARGSAP